MDERDKKIAQLEAENAQLSAENAELRALVKAQGEMLNQIPMLQSRIAELERRLGLSSKTSSKPPSSDGLKKGVRTISLKKPGKKSSGGQKGHEGHTLKQSANPDRIEEHPPEVCKDCGTELEAEAARTVAERQIIDIAEPKMEITAHRALSKVCPKCQHLNQGEFPAGINSPAQYGERLKAYALYLAHQHFIPEDRLQSVFKEVFGLSIATGSFATWSQSFADKLATFEEQLSEHIDQAQTVGVDETGFRIGGKTAWLHTKATEDATAYTTHPKRKCLEPLSNLKGAVVHDHWKPYFSGQVLSENAHVLCNAHHLRELKAVSQLDQEPWAARISRVLLKGLRLKRQHEGVVPALWATRLERCYDRILQNALAWHASQPAFGGTRAKRPGHNLALRLQARKAETLRFMYQASVPFTNNLAEQALRMMKVKQKISGGFRTMRGAEVFASIRSFFSTVNKNAFNLLEAIRNPDAFCQFKWHNHA